MRLFWLESKRLFLSLSFLIYSVLVCGFIVLNVNPLVNRSLATMPTASHYDAIYASDFQTLKNGVLSQLTDEYKENTYTTYPMGFAKTTSLKSDKRNAMQCRNKSPCYAARPIAENSIMPSNVLINFLVVILVTPRPIL
ncbi:hypothetical protein ACHEXG_01260 [Limosilactobacillus fermentum]|uniref:hypothetical protein n=1 Tax=Limosilactobacillus fermentum TaxID=1613 RepID=UPI00375299C8